MCYQFQVTIFPGDRFHDYSAYNPSYRRMPSPYCHRFAAVGQRGRDGGIFWCRRESIGIRGRWGYHLPEQTDDRCCHYFHAHLPYPCLPFRADGKLIDHAEGSSSTRHTTGSCSCTGSTVRHFNGSGTIGSGTIGSGAATNTSCCPGNKIEHKKLLTAKNRK